LQISDFLTTRLWLRNWISWGMCEVQQNGYILGNPAYKRTGLQFTQHWIDWKIRKKLNIHIAIPRRE
jgi:hypothetical protein